MNSLTPRQRRELKEIIISGIIFFALMVAQHMNLLPESVNNAWLWCALYLVPYLIVGRDVVRKCFLGIRNGNVFDECFLMTLATVGAFATQEFSEAVAVMLFYQVGEFFQRYAVGKSRNSIQTLLSIAPEYANVIREDGTVEEIDPDDVEIGDTLLIRPGEKFPVDGTVIEGAGYINTSALTGESMPRSVNEGNAVISGCINGENLMKIRADKLYEDSTVMQILELVENASSKKSQTESFITRFARYYTPAVVVAALVLAFVPPIFAGNFMDWVMRACTFLVISCPCALVISVPLAFFGGIGAASRIGVLVKGSNYLEMMAELDTVVSDKTGTLTEGHFKVSDVYTADGVSREALLGLAAAVESGSTHPIAISICEAYEGDTAAFDAKDPVNYTGKGFGAVVDGKTVLVGQKSLLEAEGISVPSLDDVGGSVCYVSSDGKFIGRIAVSDSIKKNASDAIRSMKQLGVSKVVMLTGDSKSAAEIAANELGVTDYKAELLPADKVTWVEKLLSEITGKRRFLAFIGDGINDAPVLSRADIGIAMGSLGSDAAIEAADVVIMDDDITKVPRLMKIASKTVGISRMNIVFALAVKAICLILGALGIANMWAAVFADVGVAFICILNSMRMLTGKSENM